MGYGVPLSYHGMVFWLSDPILSDNRMKSISKHALSQSKSCTNCIGYALTILDLVCHHDPIPFG